MMEQQVHKAQRVLTEQLVQQVHKVFKVKQEPKVFKAHQEQMERTELMV